MKKILMLAGLVAAVGAMAQGQFNPSNYDTPSSTKVPFTLASDSSKLGDGYAVQLLVGSSQTSLVPVGDLLSFKVSSGKGTGYFGLGTAAYVFDGTGKFPQYAVGATVFVEAEVFQTSMGNTYDASAAAGGNVGKSAIFSVTLSGPPNPPAGLAGITAVAVAPIVPEPSVIALVGLGAVALMIRRRN